MDASPAPAKIRPTIAMEFLNGRTITGADADDLIDAWGQILGWTEGRYLMPEETKQIALRFANGFHAAGLPEDLWKADALSFLRHLAAAKVVFLVEY